jgi:hypothetical protein
MYVVLYQLVLQPFRMTDSLKEADSKVQWQLPTKICSQAKLREIKMYILNHNSLDFLLKVFHDHMLIHFSPESVFYYPPQHSVLNSVSPTPRTAYSPPFHPLK